MVRRPFAAVWALALAGVVPRAAAAQSSARPVRCDAMTMNTTAPTGRPDPLTPCRPIATNNYALDMTRSTVTGSGRALGMGGAYTSMVESLDGALWNPAAYASRNYNDNRIWRLDATAAPSFIRDERNQGLVTNSWFGLIGGMLQYGLFGFGHVVDYQTFALGKVGEPALLNLNHAFSHFGAAYQFLGGQLIVGVAYIFNFVAIQNFQPLGLPATPLVTYTGHAAEVGVLWKPVDLPLRLGLAYHSQVDSTHAPAPVIEGLQRIGNCVDVNDRESCFVLPDRISTPWSIDAGISWQFGPRHRNTPWEDPSNDDDELEFLIREARQGRLRDHQNALRDARPEEHPVLVEAYQSRERIYRARETQRLRTFNRIAAAARLARYHNRPQQYIAVAFDLRITGPVDNGQGLDAFILKQLSHPSGRETTFSTRIGVESEVVPTTLFLRAGLYLEPSRFSDLGPRLHATTGFDWKVFTTTLWGLIPPQGLRLSGVLDVGASNVGEFFIDGGASVGFW